MRKQPRRPLSAWSAVCYGSKAALVGQHELGRVTCRKRTPLPFRLRSATGHKRTTAPLTDLAQYTPISFKPAISSTKPSARIIGGRHCMPSAVPNNAPMPTPIA